MWQENQMPIHTVGCGCRFHKTQLFPRLSRETALGSHLLHSYLEMVSFFRVAYVYQVDGCVN